MDVVTCAPWSARSDGMLMGSGDVLSSILNILVTLGGARSEFTTKLQSRMGTLDTAGSLWRETVFNGKEFVGLLEDGNRQQNRHIVEEVG